MSETKKKGKNEKSAQQTPPSNPPKTIADLGPGDDAYVKEVNTSPAIRQRLLDMGFVTNCKIKVERLAPTGDPIWIRVKNYQLSLRKKEAIGVLIELAELPTAAQ